MSIYDGLPIVDQCCCCISLKLGSALIAILGMIRCGTSVGLQFLPMCGSNSGTLPDIIKYSGYALAAVDILLFIFSFIFLIGICMNRYVTAIMLLHVIAIFLILNILYLILAIVVFILDSGCRDAYLVPVILLTVILGFYFMIVIRSYKDGMA